MAEIAVTPAAFDQGNPLLGGAPADLYVTLVPTPVGQRCAVTIHTASTTLTVFLDKPETQSWSETIKAKGEELTSSGLFVAQGAMMPPMNGG